MFRLKPIFLLEKALKESHQPPALRCKYTGFQVEWDCRCRSDGSESSMQSKYQCANCNPVKTIVHAFFKCYTQFGLIFVMPDHIELNQNRLLGETKRKWNNDKDKFRLKIPSGLWGNNRDAINCKIPCRLQTGWQHSLFQGWGQNQRTLNNQSNQGLEKQKSWMCFWGLWRACQWMLAATQDTQIETRRPCCSSTVCPWDQQWR